MLEPFGKRVLIKQFVEEEFSAGGIVLPDAGKERPSKGVVLSLSPDIEPSDLIARVKVGDVLVYGKYSGTPVPQMDSHYILHEDEIIGRDLPSSPAKAAPKKKGKK